MHPVSSLRDGMHDETQEKGLFYDVGASDETIAPSVKSSKQDSSSICA
jgi:hypothetical protein